MTLDAKALYEIVKDVPREAWPDGLHYEPGEDVPLWVLDLDGLRADEEGDESAEPHDDDAESPASIIPTQHAELMFEASMTRVLRHPQWGYGCAKFNLMFTVLVPSVEIPALPCYVEIPRFSRCDTRVGALAIACKEIKR